MPNSKQRLPILLTPLAGGQPVALAFDEAQHPREPSGTSHGGEFASKNYAAFRDDANDIEFYNSVHGTKFTKEDIASLVGSQPDTKIMVEREGSTLYVYSDHPLYECERAIYRDHIENNSFEAKVKGKGVGTAILINQVTAAAKHKQFAYLYTTAAGSASSEMNGYYTWPRLGYDAGLNLKRYLADEALQKFGANRVSDLMKTKDGREWWKENGSGQDMSFDLTRGSLSRKVLSNYVREKRKAREPSRPVTGGRGDSRSSVGVDRSKEVALSNFDPNEPRDEKGQWTTEGSSVAKSRDEQINSPEFKRWFGESKVVDENGKPLVVYHGTADSFKEFDLDHPSRKDTGWLGTGVYVTTAPHIADSYTNLKAGRDGPQVKALYVRLENPYYAKVADKQRIQLISHNKGAAAGRDAADQWTRELKARGHDGVILEFKASQVGKAEASKEIVVFDPAGVKSATGNRGTFDSANPDIRMSLALSAPSQSADILLAQAIKADHDVDRVEAAGLGASQLVLARIRSGFMRSLASRGHYHFSAQAELLNHLVPVMAKTMAVANLMGQRRAVLSWQEAGLEPISLDRFSEVMKEIRATGLGKDLSRLQRGYARQVYKAMADSGSKIDATTRATIANLIAQREPTGRAIRILQSTLDKLGVGDHSQAQIETLYRTEVSRAYSAGRRYRDKQRWDDIWGFRYITMKDDRVRETHASWEGTTLPKAHRFWKTHWVPCGWRCRCQIVTIYKTPGYNPREVQPGTINGRVAPADEGFRDNWGNVMESDAGLSLLQTL